MPKVKITVAETTTLGFKPADGYTAEKIVGLLKKNKLMMEGASLVLPSESPNENAVVVATITSAMTGGGKRTVELV